MIILNSKSIYFTIKKASKYVVFIIVPYFIIKQDIVQKFLLAGC
jgi:hypothetical protein